MKREVKKIIQREDMLCAMRNLTEKALTSKMRKNLPDSAFAYIDDKGNRYYPIHDKKHVQAAIAYAKKYKDDNAKKAWSNIKDAASKFGIDAGALIEGYEERGKRDGTGPFKGSAQRSVSNKGKKQMTGQPCPLKKVSDRGRK